MRYKAILRKPTTKWVSATITTSDDVVVATSAAWQLNVGRQFSTDMLLQLHAQGFRVYVVDDAGKQHKINTYL